MSESRVPQEMEEYDDLLESNGHRWRRRLIALAVLAVLVAAGLFVLWTTVFNGGGSSTAAVQTAKVQRGNISKTVSTSATTLAQSTANLSFGQSGKVTAVNVKLGQEVKQGDVLAEIQSDSLQNAVTTAQINLTNAQVKLNTLLQGSTASQLTAADQSVVQAQANYDEAVQALQDLSNPPTASALSAAQQAVTQAQSQLTLAQNARAKLDTSNSDAVAAAEAAVEKAERSVEDATDNLSLAKAKLEGAEASYHGCDANLFTQSEVPMGAASEDALLAVVAGGTSTCTTADASAALTANATYKDAADAVEQAQNDLQTAEDNLDTAKDGPTAADIASAEAAITSAQQALDTANAKLAELTAGPTQEAVTQAQDKVATAAAALTAAQAKRDETYAGSTAADIQAQQSQVQLASLSLAQAKKALEGAQIIAPFDGTVAALNINVGDTAGTGSTSTSAPIILNTPNAVVLNLSIGESDLPNVKAGMFGTATFDAISGTIFPIVIDSVGTNPTTTQGVVTYQARAHIVAGQGAGQGTGGFTGRSRNPSAGQTPQAQGTPSAANATASPPAGRGTAQPPTQGTPNAAPTASATPAATPVPGMNATVTIITAQSHNVLMVLTAAIQRTGANSVVTIQNDDGSTTQQLVETGLSDGTNTELTSGLQEGQTVIIPGATAVSSTSSQATPSTGGNRFFGGPDGGGSAPGGGGIIIRGGD
jgi:HlyD family secretion protein